VKIGLLPENRSGNKNTYLFRTKLIGFYYWKVILSKVRHWKLFQL
jgi:hypothetical protein